MSADETCCMRMITISRGVVKREGGWSIIKMVRDSSTEYLVAGEDITSRFENVSCPVIRQQVNVSIIARHAPVY